MPQEERDTERKSEKATSKEKKTCGGCGASLATGALYLAMLEGRFVAWQNVGDIGVALFVACAIFGDIKVPRFIAGTILLNCATSFPFLKEVSHKMRF